MYQRAAVGALFAVTLLVGGATSALADDGDSTVILSNAHMTISQDGDWTRYDYAEPLGGDVVVHSYDGEKTDAGCRFSGGETYPADYDLPSILEERETAVNMVDCVMTTEMGVSADQTNSDQKGSTYVTESARSTKGFGFTQAAAGAGVVALASTTKSGWQKTYYEDPVGKDVNSSKVNLTWTYNGTCVTSMSNNTTDYGWWSLTGWSKGPSATTANRTCAEAYTRSTSEFINGIFCSTVDTHTSYNPNKFSGLEDGSRSLYWIADKWGGCTNLLTFHRTVNP